MKSMICDLKLLFPPLSNQEADWLKKDKEIQKILSKSNLYMIGQREEIFFDVATIECHDAAISFCIKNRQTLSGRIFFDLSDYPKDTINLEIGPKIIKIIEGNNEVKGWFTPDKVLWEISHSSPLFKIIEEVRFDDLFEFELLYVGISKTNDSLTRLFLKPHGARTEILSNIVQKGLNSRVTDEITIFFFDVNHFNINSFEGNIDCLGYESNRIRVISDIEKAFINIMSPRFNKERYLSYPNSKDGLEIENLNGYCYSIKEELIFYTDKRRFKSAINNTGSGIVVRKGNLNYFE